MDHRRAQQLCIALATAAALSGCVSDDAVDPSVQPLEIVVGGAERPCLLNVEEVEVGTHEVTPVSEAGRATVRVMSPSGEVLFERAVRTEPAEGGGVEVPPADQGSVRLAEGEHRVECVLRGETHSVTLRVVPPPRPAPRGY